MTLLSLKMKTCEPQFNRKQPTPTALIRIKKTIPYLYLHLSRRISPANTHILSPTTIKISITRPTSRNFHPIYSADNPIGLVFWQGRVDAVRHRCLGSRIQCQPHRVGLSKRPNGYIDNTLFPIVMIRINTGIS